MTTPCAQRKGLDTQCEPSLACLGDTDRKCRPREEKYKCAVGSSFSCDEESARLCSCGTDSPSTGWCVQDEKHYPDKAFELLDIITYVHEEELGGLSSCVWTKCGLSLRQAYGALFDNQHCARRQCSSLLNGLSDKLVSDLKTIGVTLKTIPTGDSGSVAASSATTVSLSLLVIIMSTVFHLI